MYGKTVSERAFEAYFNNQGIRPRYEELPHDISQPVDDAVDIGMAKRINTTSGMDASFRLNL